MALTEEPMREVRTLNKKFDARCQHCLCAVYVLWVSDEAPPPGCAYGYDDEIWKCAAVYNRLVAVVIRQDHLKKPLVPEQEYLLGLLGPKADELLAHIRSGKEPPRHKLREPRYGAPKTRPQ